MRSGSLGLAAVVLLGALAACQREQVEQTSYTTTERSERSGNVVNDQVVTTRVKTALLAESEISGQDISVDSEGGRVTLSGTVAAPQIMRAEAIARGVEGVTEVINRLTATEGGS